MPMFSCFLFKLAGTTDVAKRNLKQPYFPIVLRISSSCVKFACLVIKGFPLSRQLALLLPRILAGRIKHTLIAGVGMLHIFIPT